MSRSRAGGVARSPCVTSRAATAPRSSRASAASAWRSPPPGRCRRPRGRAVARASNGQGRAWGPRALLGNPRSSTAVVASDALSASPPDTTARPSGRAVSAKLERAVASAPVGLQCSVRGSHELGAGQQGAFMPAAHDEDAALRQRDALVVIPGSVQGPGAGILQVRPSRIPDLGALGEGRRVVHPFVNREAHAVVPASGDEHVVMAHAHGPGVEDAQGLSRGLPGRGPSRSSSARVPRCRSSSYSEPSTSTAPSGSVTAMGCPRASRRGGPSRNRRVSGSQNRVLASSSWGERPPTSNARPVREGHRGVALTRRGHGRQRKSTRSSRPRRTPRPP